MKVNRAVRPTKRQGEPLDNYELMTMSMPSASPKNVVVQVVLRPVNLTDMHPSRWGSWAHLDLSQVVVGSEGVGVVYEVGEEVTKMKVGQRVIPLTFNRYYPSGYGLWRDYVEVPEIDLVKVPEEMSDAVAAQFFINPWTAYGLVKRLDVPKGEYMLQAGAASTVGRNVIRIAKYYGIKTINLVRKDEWFQPLKDQGADYVINSTTTDVKAKVKEITGGKGVYGALDPVAGESTMMVASCVRDGGQVLVYGSLSGTRSVIELADLRREVAISYFKVNDFGDDIPIREETASNVLHLLSNKIIEPQIRKTYPLEEFREAIKEAERDSRGGKVFLSSY
ncbi:unnamed protein product [Calypogeia fissa]